VLFRSMKEKTLIYVGAAIIVLLLITTGIGFHSNSKNKLALKEETQQKESVISQKQLVSEELDKAKSDLADLTNKKETAEKALADAQSKITDKEKRIASMSKENKSLINDRKELATLKESKAALDRSYEDLKMKQETALSRVKELEDSGILAETEKKVLSGKLAASEMYRTDNTEIFGSRGNKKDKLTYNACRTKKINLNFEVPQSLTETISFKIITPAGTTITPEDKSLSWTIEQNSWNYTASLSSVGEFEVSRKVVLTYTSKEKLKSGKYKIQIFSNDKNIGNCRVKLK
jgi:myosin heavy subunit